MGKCSTKILHTCIQYYKNRMPKPIKWIVLPLTKLLRCWFYNFSVEEISVCICVLCVCMRTGTHTPKQNKTKYIPTHKPEKIHNTTTEIAYTRWKYCYGKFNNLIFVKCTYDTHRHQNQSKIYRKSHYNFYMRYFIARAMLLILLLLYFVFWSFPNLDN